MTYTTKVEIFDSFDYTCLNGIFIYIPESF
jgi:hypothetical protein